MVEDITIPHFPAVGASLLGVLPLAPLSLASAQLARSLGRRHPSLFKRLGDQANKVFLIDPTDLPIAFRLSPNSGDPRLDVVRSSDASPWDARIAGPLAALLGLVHGAFDGDALFFSRDLIIEGDTEAVLALRNAIDNEEIDMASEITALFGPLERLVETSGANPGRSGREFDRRRPDSRRSGGRMNSQAHSQAGLQAPLELICPAGTPAAFRVAVEAGAHAVYCGFADETNARNFPGLNFSREEMAEAVRFAHKRGAKTLIAINTFPRAGEFWRWSKAVDDAVRANADAVILADLGLLDDASRRHPNLRLHLSVQAAAANADAINFYAEEFRGEARRAAARAVGSGDRGDQSPDRDRDRSLHLRRPLRDGRRALLPVVLRHRKVAQHERRLLAGEPCEYKEEGDKLVSRLGGFAIDLVAAGEPAPYPTLCKGCFETGDHRGHVFEDPSSLDAASLIPQLAAAGVHALKIEGRQRSRAYTEAVVRSFRAAVDAHAAGRPIPASDLRKLTEGQQTTSGAYRKTWR